jgi:hypothetical protein
VLGPLLQPGYQGSIDLLTRYAGAEDFAADITIRRAGINPATEERYLEELAFEIGNSQRRAELTIKARKMTKRGVRRIFALMVREQSAYEWDAGREELRLFTRTALEDAATLVAPLPLALLVLIARGAAGLVPAEQVQRAVQDFTAEALDARGNPVIKRIEQRGEQRGVARSLLRMLAARGVLVDELSQRRILACDDLATLDRWFARATTATAISDIFTA